MAKTIAPYKTSGDSPPRKSTAKANGANLGSEEKLWQAADKLRGQIGWENRGRGT